ARCRSRKARWCRGCCRRTDGVGGPRPPQKKSSALRVDFRLCVRDNRRITDDGAAVSRLLCLTLVLFQFVLPVLAHDHGAGTHLHADRLLPCHPHDGPDDEDHDHDAVYLPIAVSLEGLRDAGPDAPTPLDVSSALDLTLPSEAPLLAPEPAPR